VTCITQRHAPTAAADHEKLLREFERRMKLAAREVHPEQPDEHAGDLVGGGQLLSQHTRTGEGIADLGGLRAMDRLQRLAERVAQEKLGVRRVCRRFDARQRVERAHQRHRRLARREARRGGLGRPPVELERAFELTAALEMERQPCRGFGFLGTARQQPRADSSMQEGAARRRQALVECVSVGDMSEGKRTAHRPVTPGGDAIVAQEATLSSEAHAPLLDLREGALQRRGDDLAGEIGPADTGRLEKLDVCGLQTGELLFGHGAQRIG
jgi:hypothetical protein